MAFLLHRHAAVAPRYKSVVMDFSKAGPKDVLDSVKSKAGFEEDNHATLLSQYRHRIILLLLALLGVSCQAPVATHPLLRIRCYASVATRPVAKQPATVLPAVLMLAIALPPPSCHRHRRTQPDRTPAACSRRVDCMFDCVLAVSRPRADHELTRSWLRADHGLIMSRPRADHELTRSWLRADRVLATLTAC